MGVATATVTSKGQVTIPKKIREKLHLDPGHRIEFFEDENGNIAIRPVVENVRKLKGMVQKPAKPVTLSEMKAAIAAGGGRRR
jgi:AbrB family looped-hinge helix DNA binding protein